MSHMTSFRQMAAGVVASALLSPIVPRLYLMTRLLQTVARAP